MKTGTDGFPVCCTPTFPACCGQAFLPGGASRTVHSSLLLSGECWWASICERQPGGGEPPNTPLLPHCSQGKGLTQDLLMFVCVVCFCKLVSPTLFHRASEREGSKHSDEVLMITLGTCRIVEEACFLLSLNPSCRKECCKIRCRSGRSFTFVRALIS